ncbi:MAG: hypothetical protein ACO2ZM_09910, partial [Francisellaceae bacterium]
LKHRKSQGLTKGHFYYKLLPARLQRGLYVSIYRGLSIQIILAQIIESFMGLATSRMNRRAITAFIIYSLFLYVLINLMICLVFKITLVDSVAHSVIFLPCYLLSILAMFNKYDKPVFAIALVLSVISTLTAMSSRVYFGFNYLNILYVAVIIILLIYSIKRFPATRKSLNSKYGGWVLIIGLLLIGTPGLGSFMIYERLGQMLIMLKADSLINAYFIFSLNIIVFFRFYYANYVGPQATFMPYDVVKRV